MPRERRFLLAPAFARLIQRDGTATSRIVEGHFLPNPQRTQLVRVERDQAVLILFVRNADGTIVEERAEVPIAHAEALIDVAPGTIAFDRLPFVLSGGASALLDRFVVPEGLNLLRAASEPESDSFEVPEWFGPEVTDRPEFERSALALGGAPELAEVEVSNKALDTLLDTLDGHTDSASRRPIQGSLLQPGMSGGRPTVAIAQTAGGVGASPFRPGQASGDEPADVARPAEPPSTPRINVRALDDGIARLARTLTPRSSRTP